MIRRSITAKVLAAALIALMCILGLAGFGLSSLLTIGPTVARLNAHVTTESQLAAQFHITLTRAVAEGQTLALAGDRESLEQAQALIGEAQTLLAQLVEASEQEDGIDPGEVEDEYQTLHEDRSHIISTIDQLIATIEAGDVAARQEALEELEEIEDQLADLDGTARAMIEEDQRATSDLTYAAIQRGIISVSLGFGLIVLLIVIALILLRWQIVAPLKTLAATSQQFSAGQLDQPVRVTSDDEMGVLQVAFNQMSAAIREQTTRLEREIASARAARQEAEQAHGRIAEQLTQINAQQDMIREMSVPVLPVTARTLVMPLVGALDTARLMLLQEQALRAIERSEARYILLDITGVSLVDAQVARGLIRVMQAVRLLGAEAVLVGIRPEVAQSIVGLGIQLDDITSRSSLQSGIAYALGQHMS